MEEWIFTFGTGHKLEGKCVRVSGSREEAREKMIKEYGLHWAFQYPSDEWERMKEDEWYGEFLEKEVPFGYGC